MNPVDNFHYHLRRGKMTQPETNKIQDLDDSAPSHKALLSIQYKHTKVWILER